PFAPHSVQKAPHCMPRNTPGVFPDLTPHIWLHLLRLVAQVMADRLLAGSFCQYLKVYARMVANHGIPGPREHYSCRFVAKSPKSAFLVKRPSTGSGRPEPVEGHISHPACEGTDTFFPSCASRFTNNAPRAG